MLLRIWMYLGLTTLGIMEMSFLEGSTWANERIVNDQAIIQYRLSFRQANMHRVDVELFLPTDGKEEIELMMPVWTPGSYLVREYARQIEQVLAVNGSNNKSLKVRKTDKNHWVIACDGANDLLVRYSLYCREMSVRTNWVEHDFAFLTGAATFLTRSDMVDHPHVVRIDALPNWPTIATSLQAVEARDPWTRTANNFDQLVDSPIVMGMIDIQTFEVGGAKHHLATLGGESFWDTASAAKDVAKIVAAEQLFWAETPYKEYWFLNLATEAGGGLEHDNSCVLMTGRWAQRQKSKYSDWLGLVSHEFFHTWNVRRLRPKVLKQYDYNNEQYFQELWFAEGITSYYDDLFVARTGLCKPKDYLERLSKNIASVQNAPGRNSQSLTESSFDSWIKYYRPDENANNSRVSYYLKGALIGLLLDVEIRSKTNNSKSLDDVLRLLWKNYLETGYTNADVSDAVEQVSGQCMDDWLDQMLNTTKELDYSKLLEWYGLDWKHRDAEKDASNDKPKFGNVTVGLELKSEQGRAMVEKVVRESPASQAGFNSGDELISFDGFRVTVENWTERLNLYRANDIGKCLISRRGKIVELTLKLVSQPDHSWSLVRVTKPTDEQERNWRNWLAIPEPEKKSETEASVQAK